MKRWIIPIVFALAIHVALYRFDLISMPPLMAMHENRTVTISLVQMRPLSKPRRQVQPVKIDSRDPIAPLARLTPKPPLVQRPDPVPIPEPVKVETPQAPTAQELPAVEDPPAKPLEGQTAQESVSAPVGPDQAVVQASIPLYHLNPPPTYPAVARRRNYQGTVLLDVLVTQQGLVSRVEVAESCGYEMLDRRARKSVRQWRFEPARRFGRPIEMWVQVPIKFELR